MEKSSFAGIDHQIMLRATGIFQQVVQQDISETTIEMHPTFGRCMNVILYFYSFFTWSNNNICIGCSRYTISMMKRSLLSNVLWVVCADVPLCITNAIVQRLECFSRLPHAEGERHGCSLGCCLYGPSHSGQLES